MIEAVQLASTPDASWPDEKLVEHCLKGNAGAWHALLEKYTNLIYSIPIKLDLRDEAADIFQSVCLDLLNELQNVREPRALPKWIMQATYHRCLRHRSESRRAGDADEAEEQMAAAPSAEALPEDLVLQLEREQKVRDAIATLNPRCREMVRLLFFEDAPRPYAEVAAQLGLATGSIGFIRGRCLSALKKSLQKAGL